MYNYQQILQQTIKLWQLQILTARNVAALLQQTERLVQGANVQNDILFLCREEHIHVGHVLGSTFVASGHHQNPTIDPSAQRLLALHARYVAECHRNAAGQQ